MIRYLLKPEDHQNAYVWVSVLLAHAFIGVVLGAFVGVLITMLGYALFELFQMIRSGEYLIIDSIVDFGAVTLGAMFVHQPVLVIVILTIIAIKGIRNRNDRGYYT